MREVHENIEKYKKWFDVLFSTTNGYAQSMLSRQDLPYYDRSHTYGEVSFEGFMKMFEKVEVATDDVFYDLGCGVGKAVILAAMFHPFKKVVGIEILPELYRSAKHIVDLYRAGATTHLNKNTDVDIRQGDITKLSYQEASVVFIHGTCFDNALMRLIEKRLETLPQGARIISASQLLFSPSFMYKGSEEVSFIWGITPVFYYERG